MLITALLCLCLASALAVPDAWAPMRAANPAEVLSLRFALRQKNIAKLEETLLDVSDPKSPNYGQWWTQSAILDLIAPPADVRDTVSRYLLKAGAVAVADQGDVLLVKMAVRDVSTMLKVEFFNYIHENGKAKVTRTPADAYTIPAEISQYIDLISGVVEFPRIRTQRTRAASPAATDPYVIPLTLQIGYNLPSNFTANKNSSVCVAEFQNDLSYNKDDLTNFVAQMGIPNIDVDHIVGPYNGDSPDAESTLDVQYGGAVAINTSMWFWTVQGWMYEFATDLFNATEAPLVVSMSWGWPEPNQCQIDAVNCNGESSHNYVNRLNIEFAKIGMRGITLVAASGDQGAPGDDDPSCSNSTSPLSTIFPGASPWVLSVGATMLSLNASARAPDAALPPICKTVTCATTVVEEVCSYPQALITTGGGFSNFSPRPAWQNDVVNAYLKSGVTLPKSTFFNASNRGFPDVSALGHNYLIDYAGRFIQVDGTSCSSPVIAGMLSLINTYLLNNNKKPLGFVAPLLYQAYAKNPAIYNDITSGNNKCTEYCCDQAGYLAYKGWDAATGLGTPDYQKLLAYVQTLHSANL